MEELTSCKIAIENCLRDGTFSLAHLYKEEKAMDMHIHDCYELYYSISGGKQFLIDNRFYPISPGDLFVINQYESHKLSQVDSMIHERIVFSIHPDYTKRLSTASTDLDRCFSHRPEGFQHRLSLNKEQQQRFLYYVNKILSANGYAHDIIEQAAFMELLVMINSLSASLSAKANLSAIASLSDIADSSFATEPASVTDLSSMADPAAGSKETPDPPGAYKYNRQVDDILAYINRNISSPISIELLAGEFFLSGSYLCRIFKSATGTTINKYITARRISIAKGLLNEGLSVSEVFDRSGFTDYSAFFKAFTKAVGISPKKYAGLSMS